MIRKAGLERLLRYDHWANGEMLDSIEAAGGAERIAQSIRAAESDPAYTDFIHWIREGFEG